MVVENGTPFLFKSALDTGRRMRSFLYSTGINVSVMVILCAYTYVGFTLMNRNDIMSLFNLANMISFLIRGM